MTNENLDNAEYADNGCLFDNIQRLPLNVAGGSGSGLAIEGGPTLLDYWGDEGVCALGYNSEEYNAAIASFVRSGQPHQLPDVYPHEYRQKCASMLCERTGMDRVFYANSGTEANEAAIKLARKYWWDKQGRPMLNEHVASHADRFRVVTVQGNFHGRTGLSLAASDPRVSPYHRWGFEPGVEGFGAIDRVDLNTWELGVADGRKLPEGIDPPWETIAAVILAPVLGNNLVKTYPKDFWDALADIRKRHGCLLIYDDVQAGMGRAGAVATWRTLPNELKPDIMTLGKGIAMGFPMSTMLAREEVAQAFTPGVHFNTFGGSPFVCHMAMEMMFWLDAHQGEANKRGEYIRRGFVKRNWIRAYDGAGMLNAFTPDFDRFGYNGYDLCRATRERGLSLMTHRPLGPIRFTPPLNVAPAELDLAFSILDDAHQSLAT